MKWYEKLWRTPARKFLLIAGLIVSGVGAPVAVQVGTAVDEGIQQVEESGE